MIEKIKRGRQPKDLMLYHIDGRALYFKNTKEAADFIGCNILQIFNAISNKKSRVRGWRPKR